MRAFAERRVSWPGVARSPARPTRDRQNPSTVIGLAVRFCGKTSALVVVYPRRLFGRWFPSSRGDGRETVAGARIGESLTDCSGLPDWSWPVEVGIGGPAELPRLAEGETTMLWTIAVILLVLWGLGLVTSYTIGGYIHILLVMAVIAVLIRMVQGRKLL